MSNLKDIHDVLIEIKVDQAEIRKDLNYHIHRTNRLEELLTKELPPLKRHVDGVQLGIKSLAYLAGLSGLAGLLGRLMGIL